VTLITGRTLGGYIAEIIARPTACLRQILRHLERTDPFVKLGGSVTTGFHNFKREKDLIGNFNSALEQHEKWSVYVEGCGHNIANKVKYSKKSTHITNRNMVSNLSSYRTGYYNPK
jgi:hypothetical protein